MRLRKFSSDLFVCFCTVSLVAVAGPTDATAFDPIAWVTGDDTPKVSPDTLPYKVEFDADGVDKTAVQALKDVSNLHKLRTDPPADGEMLVRRAQIDAEPMLRALWGSGYYDASVNIEIASVPLRDDGAAAAQKAEEFRNSGLVPITVRVTPGSLFKLRNISVVDAATMRPFDAQTLPPHVLKIAPGMGASAGDLQAAQGAIVDYFRAQSYPLVRARDAEPLVDHRNRTMDITLVIDRGPRAGFGPVGVSGTTNVDPRVVQSYIYPAPGDPYSPDQIARIRKSVLQVPAIQTVRVREARDLNGAGQLPFTAEVTERPNNVLGASARFSTLDGPSLRGYWQHRNLFGGAESLRVEADVFVPPRTNQSALDTLRDFGFSDLGGRLRTTFIKPALNGSRNDLLLDGMVERDRTGGDRYGGYESERATASASIRHRFSDTFSAQIGIAGDVGRTTDTLGTVDYHLVGIPVQVSYDTTDHALDPTKGIRLQGFAATYPDWLGSSVSFTETRAQASVYRAMDESARIVLAGRVAAGSLFGADTALIPANHRFYAGGGGSVRGFRYRSISPLGPTGEVVGGSNLLEASFEARIKVTDTIGIVPFVDVGGAFNSGYSNFGEEMRVAAGVGLRYYTAIGPIRLDVALPINKRPGESAYAFYVGIGQAF